MSAEVRISPDGANVAIRNRDSASNPWRVTNGGYYADFDVADWKPLVPAQPDDRVTCPWCSRPDRTLTARGRIRYHLANPGAFVSDSIVCAGTGNKPAEYDPDAAS